MDSHDQPMANIDGYIISFYAIYKHSPVYQDRKDRTDVESVDTNEDSTEQRKYYQTNNWETISVSEKFNTYTLRNLKCGTLYRIKVEAFNEMGNGESSDVLEFATMGQGNAQNYENEKKCHIQIKQKRMGTPCLCHSFNFFKKKETHSMNLIIILTCILTNQLSYTWLDHICRSFTIDEQHTSL